MQSRKKTLLEYVLPTMAASCSSFLYAVVDGIFVGRGVGADALGAVNLALPFTVISTALAILMMIGGVTMIAIHLGRGDHEEANNAFRHSLVAAGAIGVFLSIVGMMFAKQIAVICGANNTFLDMTTTYIFYYSMFSLPYLLSIALQGFVRNDGAPVLVSVSVIIAAVTNIFLDWLFVFPLKMGVMGAAIATGIGQSTCFIILTVHLFRQKGILRFGRFRPSFTIWGEMVCHGLPEMIAQFGIPITTLFMNRMLLQTLGDLSVSAFAVMSYMLSFSMGLFFGVAEGIQPLLGQSYGAERMDDLKYYFRASMLICFLVSFVMYGICALKGEWVSSLFNPDPVLGEIVAKASPKFCLYFFFISAGLMITTYLYSTKRTVQAVVIAVLRCIVINSAVIILLTKQFGNAIVWYTVGQRIKGDANSRLFFRTVEMTLHSQGVNRRILPIMRHAEGVYQKITEF